MYVTARHTEMEFEKKIEARRVEKGMFTLFNFLELLHDLLLDY